VIRFERLLVGAVLAATWCACAAGPSATTPPSPIGAGAAAHAAGAAKRAKPTFYILNVDETEKAEWVGVYGDGGTSLLRKIVVKRKYANPDMAADAAGHFYLYDGQEPVALSIYASRAAKLVESLDQLDPFGILTLDGSGNLYTTCRKQGEDLCEYAHAPKGVLKPGIVRRIRVPGALPFDLAVDDSGNIAMSGGIGGLFVFAPGQTQPYWKITGSGLVFLSNAFDSSGNLYVVTGQRDSSVSAVSVYAPGSTLPSRTITDGATAAGQIAFDGSGNLYVLNDCLEDCGSQPQSVSVYAPGGSVPVRTITSGIASGQGHGMAVDAAGDLVVTNVGNYSDAGSFAVYAPGGSKPIRTVSSGVRNPGLVVVGP
jgi:hypothetical protein